MAHQKPGEPRNLRTSVKGPLMFSAFWAVVAFFAVLIFASGGSARSPRFDLAFTAAGIAFIVTLVIAAMLSMSYKDNASHLGKGSGVNLSSAKKSSQGHGGHGTQGTQNKGTQRRPDAPGTAGTGESGPDGGAS
ncbi:hypothetical protein [Arthrobacter globiformis]|uniref:hypothetical protein n=1 Tax=Arthrobacter globiformis TaxID=1665 RepID=UPI002794EEBC|nr:hypothetical protein [Arthrobacter globiformis]MDQ0616152.1 hypothetical protein [Arthrobacter globiformis]